MHIEGNKEDERKLIRDKVRGKNSYLLVTGSKNGKVQVWHLSNKVGQLKLDQPLLESEEGISYGSISSIDVNQQCSEIVCGTESGEMIQFDLKNRLN